MMMQDDSDIEDRFARRMAAADAEIPAPPPMHALRAARPSITSRGGAGSRGSWTSAAVVVTILVAALAGGALLLRGAPLTPAGSGTAPAGSPAAAGASRSASPSTPAPSPAAASPSVTSPSSEFGSPAPTANPIAVDKAIQSLNLRDLVQGLAGGSKCTVVTLASGGGQATNGDNTLRSWDSSSASLVTCPHASGDISIAYAFNDALLAELARLGTTDVGGTSTINDAGNQPLPAVWGWHLLTDHGVVVVWVTVLDASGPDIQMTVSVAQVVRSVLN